MTNICRAVRVDQSPLNKLQWCVQFECGHEEWITRKGRPSIKTMVCGKCKATAPAPEGGQR